jgi:hypothetical protein
MTAESRLIAEMYQTGALKANCLLLQCVAFNDDLDQRLNGVRNMSRFAGSTSDTGRLLPARLPSDHLSMRLKQHIDGLKSTDPVTDPSSPPPGLRFDHVGIPLDYGTSTVPVAGANCPPTGPRLQGTKREAIDDGGDGQSTKRMRGYPD